jgi:hypothetical protein
VVVKEKLQGGLDKAKVFFFVLIILYTSYSAYNKPRLIPGRSSWSYKAKVTEGLKIDFLCPGLGDRNLLEKDSTRAPHHYIDSFKDSNRVLARNP